MMASQTQKPWLPSRAAPDLIFINANLVDVENGEVIPNSTIELSKGRIKKISADDEAKTRSRGTAQSPEARSSVVDLKSAYLCPGFIDLHVHLTAAPGQPSFSTLFSQDQTAVALKAAYVAKQMLYRGFTTVRDTGGSNASLRSAIAENLISGPRLFIAGKALSQTGGHADLRGSWQGSDYKCCDSRTPGFGRVCDGVPECLEAARDELRQGADFLKVMCGGGVVSPADPLSMLQFTSEELQAITRTAESIGTYVTAHAYTDSAIRHAVSNGCKGIEHGNFMTRSTAEWLQASHPDVTITPTLATYYAMDMPENRAMFDESAREKNTLVLNSGLQSLSLLSSLPDPKPNVAFGTDLLSHMHNLQLSEFRIRGSILPAAEVLRQATVNSARVLHRRAIPLHGGKNDVDDGSKAKKEEKEEVRLQFGVIREGAYADLLLLSENPLAAEGGAGVLERFRIDQHDNADETEAEAEVDTYDIVENENENEKVKTKKKKKQTGLAVLKEGRVVWSLLEGDGLMVDETYR